jgi:hypothetical protein
MNKHSATKKPSAKPGRNATARKPSPRKPSPRKANARAAVRKPETATNGLTPASKIGAIAASITAVSVKQASVSHVVVRQASVSPVATIGSSLRAHKFRVGQTVSYTSSPISRPGATGSYKVVRLLPSDGDDYQYRIKHAGEAFERVAKESQLELEG